MGPGAPGCLKTSAAPEHSPASHSTASHSAAAETTATPAKPTARAEAAGSAPAAAREVLHALRAVEACTTIAIQLIERVPARIDPIASGRAQRAAGHAA